MKGCQLGQGAFELRSLRRETRNGGGAKPLKKAQALCQGTGFRGGLKGLGLGTGYKERVEGIRLMDRVVFRAQPELKLGRNDPLPQNKPGSECPTGQLGVTASIAPEARLTVQKTHEWPSLSLFLATAASRNCLLKAYRRGVQPITSELDDEYIYIQL